MSRDLDWPGCFNTRDLGGLPTATGRTTRRGALVRSDSVSRLTERGWAALWAYGVRTVVDLRNHEEIGPDAAPRPPGLRTVRVPFADLGRMACADRAHPEWRGTPLCYRPFLDRFPRRTAAVAQAIARARPGGVLFHCVAGRDRTGLISVLLLALAGVSTEAIVADYARSAVRLVPLHAAVGESNPAIRLRGVLAEAGTTEAETIAAALDGFDPAAYLSAAGLSAAELAGLRGRLLGAPGLRSAAGGQHWPSAMT